MNSLPQHLRLAVRSLRRTPAFAITAILTLALGIGLATAVFTVADALLLRRLPVVEQDRIVVLWGRTRDRSFDHFPLTLTDAREFAQRSVALEGAAFVAYEGAWPKPIREGDQVSRLNQALVSGGFFDVLGVHPALGRTLRSEDDVLGAAPVVVLSHAAWQERFGGDRDVIGRQLLAYDAGTSYTIVGVMPEGLDYPRGVQYWAPVTPARTGPEGDAPNAHVDVIGRLAAGATAEQARDELTAWFGRAEAPTLVRELVGVVHTLSRLVLGDTRPAIFAFAAASGLLLLITCINVANLLLVRGLARVREVAVRSALGASRTRVIGQLLGENALLAIAGGLLGIVAALAAVQGFLAFAPAELPRLDEIELNASALGGALSITGVSMLIFGLAPAIVTSRTDLQQVLRSGVRRSASLRSRLAREVMVAGQVALAVLVLAAAGVITRSLLELQRAELALEPEGLLIGELALRSEAFVDASSVVQVIERLVSTLEEIPGVQGVSPTVAIPFAGTGGWDGRPQVEGQSPEEAASNPMLNMEVIGPSYFAALGIPILRGRGFSDADDENAQPVIVISESAARHYWPDEDPIGKRLIGPGPQRANTVIGVVPETRYRDLRDARLSIYFSLRQSTFPYAPTNLAIRTSGPAAQMVPTIRRAIEQTAPDIALVSAAPFESLLEKPLAQARLNALLLAAFAGAALLLAAVGLFGVMAATVRQRTRELGIRMALGATAQDLRRMVLARGLAIAAAGLIVGMLGALLANRLLVAMLYEVSPTDGATLAVVGAVLVLVAIVATAIPARASTRVDPVIALRAET
jgi:predicted permease